MVDQKNKFSPIGIVTEYICEAQHDDAAKHKVLDGQVSLVYISPESIVLNKKYRRMLLSPFY